MNETHLDDDLLSAFLDGEAAPGAGTHLAACAGCRARLEALDSVRRSVAASPPAAPPGLADRAVAAALAAFTEGGVDAAPVTRPTSPPPPAPTAGDGRRPGDVVPMRRRVPAWALAAAAAVAALVVAVPILTRDTGDEATQSASGAARDATVESDAADDAVLDGGDLGAQADQLALGRILTSALGAPAPVGAADAGRSTEGASDAADTPAAAAPAPDAPGSTSFQQSAPADTRECADEVRASYGRGLGPLVYRATLQWQGAPSVLLAYRLADTSGPGPDHRAFVMALDGCRLLVVQGF